MNLKLEKKKYKQYHFLYSVILLVCCMVLGITGCGEKSADESDYQIYYVNTEKTKLEASGYDTDTTSQDKLIDELLQQMSQAPNEVNMQKVLPDNVKIQEISLDNTELQINYDTDYSGMKKQEEYLCRAATVLTLTQIEGVDTVSIYVDGQSLTDSSGESIGAMTAANFVDNSGATINSYQSVNFVLYFANRDGDMLVDRSYEGITLNNISMEKYIVEQLIKGPSVDSIKRTLSPNLKLLSISTVDGICYVNFDETFLEEAEDVSSEVAIYSIVNSLCDLGYINKVQISVNGEVDIDYQENISLNQLFRRNLDMVEG